MRTHRVKRMRSKTAVSGLTVHLCAAARPPYVQCWLCRSRWCRIVVRGWIYQLETKGCTNWDDCYWYPADCSGRRGGCTDLSAERWWPNGECLMRAAGATCVVSSTPTWSDSRYIVFKTALPPNSFSRVFLHRSLCRIGLLLCTLSFAPKLFS